MNTKRDNTIVVDLNKVQWAKFYYRNQHGQTKGRTSPLFPTVRLVPIEPAALAHFHPDYPDETEYQRAKRLGILDIWNPELCLKLHSSGYLIYTGDKAITLWKTWSAKIFGKK